MGKGQRCDGRSAVSGSPLSHPTPYEFGLAVGGTATGCEGLRAFASVECDDIRHVYVKHQ